MKGIEQMRTALPFEQQPRESNKAFAAFSLYLSLGPERTLVAVAQKLQKSGGLIARWSRKFDWGERVAAHGTHFAVVEREATEALVRGKAATWLKRHEEHRDEEWAMRGELMAAGRKVLKKFMDEGRGATLGDVARALDLASKLGRLAAGMPTEVKEITGEGGGPIRVEVSVALEKIYGAPLPGEVVDVEEVGNSQSQIADSQGRKP
jgi:hypothetical protein